MHATSTSLTSKNQVTVPAWVRKVLKLKSKMEIVWMELIPGEICVLSKNIGPHENPIENLCGILQGKVWMMLILRKLFWMIVKKI